MLRFCVYYETSNGERFYRKDVCTTVPIWSRGSLAPIAYRLGTAKRLVTFYRRRLIGRGAYGARIVKVDHERIQTTTRLRKV